MPKASTRSFGVVLSVTHALEAGRKKAPKKVVKKYQISIQPTFTFSSIHSPSANIATIWENSPHIITFFRPNASASSPLIALDTQRDNPANAITRPAKEGVKFRWVIK